VQFDRQHAAEEKQAEMPATTITTVHIANWTPETMAGRRIFSPQPP